MRFAILNNMFARKKEGKYSINFGDNLQIFAIENLYKKMGININELIRIDFEDLKTYHGEEVLLPINGSLFNSGLLEGNELKISDKIYPVFISVHLGGGFSTSLLTTKNIDFLKKNDPIGCRDSYTKEVLSSCGIKVYLNGCMTLTFDKRNSKKTQKKIIGIDIANEISKFIPDKYGKKMEFMSQQVYISSNETIEHINNLFKNHYNYIKENASLVITSRLHILLPCIAMGIPVIFAKNTIDSRFGWIDSMVTLYDINEYGVINWNPEVINCEEQKRLMIECAIKRIDDKLNNINDNDYNDLWKSSEKKYIPFNELLLGLDKVELFMKKIKKNEKIIYDLWGAGSKAEIIHSYIKEKFKQAELGDVIDLYSKELFYGKSPVLPSKYNADTDHFVIVTGAKAAPDAYDILKEKLDKVLFISDVIFVNE